MLKHQVAVLNQGTVFLEGPPSVATQRRNNVLEVVVILLRLVDKRGELLNTGQGLCERLLVRMRLRSGLDQLLQREYTSS